MAAAYDLPATLFDECPVPFAGIPGEGCAGSIAPARAGRPADHGAPAGTHAGEQSGALRLVSPYLILTRGCVAGSRGSDGRGRHRDPDQLPSQHGRAPWSMAPIDVTAPGSSVRGHPVRADDGGVQSACQADPDGEGGGAARQFQPDPRSLMLNTELMLHLHSPRLCDELQQLIDGWLQQAVHPVAASLCMAAPAGAIERLVTFASLVVSGIRLVRDPQSFVRLRG